MWVSVFSHWALGMGLCSSDLTARAFTGRAILPAPLPHVLKAHANSHDSHEVYKYPIYRIICILALWNCPPLTAPRNTSKYCVWFCCLELKCYSGFLGSISALNGIIHVSLYPHRASFSIPERHVLQLGTIVRYFPPTNIYLILRECGFSALIIQLNFITFRRKMFSFTAWKNCTFQRKIVAIRWVLHLPNTNLSSGSLWYLGMGLLV